MGRMLVCPLCLYVWPTASTCFAFLPAEGQATAAVAISLVDETRMCSIHAWTIGGPKVLTVGWNARMPPIRYFSCPFLHNNYSIFFWRLPVICESLSGQLVVTKWTFFFDLGMKPTTKVFCCQLLSLRLCFQDKVYYFKACWKTYGKVFMELLSSTQLLQSYEWKWDTFSTCEINFSWAKMIVPNNIRRAEHWLAMSKECWRDAIFVNLLVDFKVVKVSAGWSP